MSLSYSDFQTATGISIPATANKYFPSQTSITSIISNKITATTGEFYTLTDTAFSATTKHHLNLLWLLVKRELVYYRRNNLGSTVSQQTPSGNITFSESLGSLDQLEAQINTLVNKIKLEI